MPVDGTEITLFSRPVVPNPHTVVLKVFDVGVAGQKPQQFVNDGFHVVFWSSRAESRRPDIASGGRSAPVPVRSPLTTPSARRRE